MYPLFIREYKRCELCYEVHEVFRRKCLKRFFDHMKGHAMCKKQMPTELPTQGGDDFNDEIININIENNIESQNGEEE